MGLIKKLLKRDLTPEEQAEKSRKEKEWVERNWERGYKLAEKLSLGEKVQAIDRWGTKYPKTFFGIIFASLFACIILNRCVADNNQDMHETMQENIQSLNNTGDIGYRPPQDTPLGTEILQMYEELDGIDRKIRTIINKDSLTREDSIQVRDLLIQGERINVILNGTRKTNEQ